MRAVIGFGLIVTLSLSACSPQTYDPEVAAFAQGVESSILGMTVILDDLAKDRLAIERATLADTKPQIGLDERCGEGIAELVDNEQIEAIQSLARDLEERCQFKQLGDGVPLAGSIEKRSIDDAISDILPSGQTVALIEALKQYSAALVDITGSQDQLELNEALTTAQSSFGQLACAVKVGCPQLNGEAASLAGTLIRNSFLGQLERKRYQSLRDVVDRSDDAIQIAITELTRLQSIAIGIRAQKALTELTQALGDLALSTDKESWLRAHEALLDRRAILVATLEHGGRDVFTQMGGAHRALKLALNDPKRGLEDLREQLIIFTKNARELAAIYL